MFKIEKNRNLILATFYYIKLKALLVHKFKCLIGNCELIDSIEFLLNRNCCYSIEFLSCSEFHAWNEVLFEK